MLSSLHIKTVVKTLSEYRLVDKEYVVQAAYNHVDHAARTGWQGVLDNITYKMEDEIGLEPSEYKNADLLLNKLQLKHKGHLFPWHILALSKIYLRYSKKLNSENISEKDQ